MMTQQNMHKEEPTATISMEESCGGLLRVKRAIGHRGLSGETLR